MKLSECNERERKAYINIAHAANWLIGGWENTMQDNEEDSEEYKSAAATLANHDELVKLVYAEATSSIYDEDGFVFGPFAQKMLKDIRFCGKEWLMARCEARVRKCGY